MKKKVGIILSSVLLIGSLLVGCMGTGDEATGPTLDSRLTALEAKCVQLDARIAGIPTGSLNDMSNRLSSVDTRVGNLESRLSGIESRLDALESAQSSGNNTELLSDETTRWSTDVWLDYTGYKLVNVDLENKRIEDGGDYNLYLELRNENILISYETVNTLDMNVFDGDFVLYRGVMYKWVEEDGEYVEALMSDIYKEVVIDEIEISLHPLSGDRVKVDSDKTYLDNYRAPFLDWEVTVPERSDGTCRSIKAVSGKKFTLPIPERFEGTPECPQPYEMRLLFELYYK